MPTTSFDKDKIKILLLEGVHTSAVANFNSAGYHNVTRLNHALQSAELAEAIRDVHMIGGRVRSLTQSVVGARAVESIRDLRVDVAFLGTNGISADHGFSTPDPEEAMAKRAMISAARRTVVLADSSKIGVDVLTCFAGLDEVEALVTDSGVSPSALATLTDHSLEVLVA